VHQLRPIKLCRVSVDIFHCVGRKKKHVTCLHGHRSVSWHFVLLA